MAEELIIDTQLSKEEKYIALLPQLKALIKDETDVVANMANIAAALKETFGFLWVGFYSVKNNELVLGPFQGPIACTRIALGKGVCGTAWQEQKAIVVPDVEKFSGHIACSSLSRSEVVVPHFGTNKKVDFILDVDSIDLNAFDDSDVTYLTQIVQLINL